MPPTELAVRLGHRFSNLVQDTRRRHHDRLWPTYALSRIPQGNLQRLFVAPPMDMLRSRDDSIAALTSAACAHRFNLLGSGPVKVAHGIDCQGLEGHCYPSGSSVSAEAEGSWLNDRVNRANVSAARKLWRLIDAGYQPIDWQLDFKSGFRWSELTWSRDIHYGHLAGVDVKVPWELARMQHLPQFGWAYALAQEGAHGFDRPNVYLREFRNQVLDFIATNAPRFGVNWCCTMDVGIRVSNWLVAYDLFKAFGAKFDAAFESALLQSVYEHGRHIIGNLEWSPTLRSNHYLANIASLVFVAAFLPSTHESDAWLEFAVRELVYETGLQFLPDGGNFEASTSYHRLSAEMVTDATAIVLALPAVRREIVTNQTQQMNFHPGPPAPALPIRLHPRESHGTPFPQWYWERLQRVAEFTAAITRPDGRIPQIGDNDSGRFLKLWPMVPTSPNANASLAEDQLDHRHLMAALCGLLGETQTDQSVENSQVESKWIRPLLGASMKTVVNAEVYRGHSLVKATPAASRHFPDFGLTVFRTAQMFVVFRCGQVGQNGNGGHAHNDQLSFDLSVADVPTIVDPGTYLYTPLPDRRNEMRSTNAHNTLLWGDHEQNTWQAGLPGLFCLKDVAGARIVRRTHHAIIAEHFGFGTAHRRSFQVRNKSLKAVDECLHQGDVRITFHLSPETRVINQSSSEDLVLDNGATRLRVCADSGVWSVNQYRYSAAYGESVASHVCVLKTSASRTAWCIEVI